MPDSAREQILAAVKTQLLTISGIKQVSRDGIDALRIMDFPAIVLGIRSDSVEHLLNDFVERHLDIDVTGYIKTENDVSKTLETLTVKIVEKMASDRHLGLGDKIDSYELGSSGQFPLNEEWTEAAEGIAYRIRYRTTRIDPYTLVG